MNHVKISESFSTIKKPINSTILPSEAYVWSLASLPSYYAAASSYPTDAIYVLDKSDLGKVIHTLPGHKGGISAIRVVERVNDDVDVLLSWGKDGIVRTWDVRNGRAAIESECLFGLLFVGIV